MSSKSKPDPVLPELLEANIESNDRLAEGLVRGVQEMGASQAKLPIHIDGETWDVTVRFRGAQPESQFEDWVIKAARQILAEIALEKPRLRTSRIAEIIQAARGGAQPEPDDVLAALKEWESDTGGEASPTEGNAFMDGYRQGRARAGSCPAPSPARTVCAECYEGAHGQCIEQGCYCNCQAENL